MGVIAGYMGVLLKIYCDHGVFFILHCFAFVLQRLLPNTLILMISVVAVFLHLRVTTAVMTVRISSISSCSCSRCN